MKIAFFTDSYHPQVNGLVTSIDTFVDDLMKQGHEVHIFAPNVPGHVDKSKRVKRFRSFQFPAYKEYRIAVPKIIKHRFDVVHVHSPFSLGLSGIIYARKNNVPVVGTFHTLFSEYGHYLIKSETLLKIFKKTYKRLTWSYLRWFYNQCDFVTAPSERIKFLLAKHGVKKPIYFIPTGVKTRLRNKNKKALRSKYGFGDEKIILHIGRITKEKNILFILNSLRRLLKKENAVFVITSDGPYKNELQEHAKNLGLRNKVMFTGYLSNEQLKDFYAIADLFVLASKSETQGIVLIEAVANKLPIVALNAPVTGDFLKENDYGIVANAGNFAEKVSLALRNEKLRIASTKNVSKILEKYDSERCARELANVYKKAIRSQDTLS